ncbi:hypothetical protein [Nonomuraea typhae]|uniref:Uncharacterized protein n=1 Tax=Nonomuraea typhae TaxID=2603600 RepID=A0ABW7Z6W3_9ACTN
MRILLTDADLNFLRAFWCATIFPVVRSKTTYPAVVPAGTAGGRAGRAEGRGVFDELVTAGFFRSGVEAVAGVPACADDPSAGPAAHPATRGTATASAVQGLIRTRP